MSGNIKRKLAEGSFTVEMAGMMGVILLVIFTCIYANLYIHNKVWLSVAAYEASVSGGLAETERKGTAEACAKERGRQLGNVGFYGLTDFSMQVSGGEKVEVSYQGNMKSILGGFQFEVIGKGHYKVIRPSEFIWNYKMLQEMENMWEGE